MRAFIKILVFVFISGFAVPAYSGNPVAYLNFATFNTPGGQSYFETYLSVIGSSLKFVKNQNNKYVAKAHVILAFKKGDSIVASSNFNVVSPQVDDTLTKPNFVDVHRFWLKKGDYTLLFTLDDPNDASHTVVTGRQPVYAGYSADSVCISDAEFLSSCSPSATPGPYNKCGMNMIPYVFSDYPPSIKKIMFYFDIYNTEKATPRQKVTVTYSVEDDGAYWLNVSGHFFASVQRDADTVIPFLAQAPVDKLPSGNYFLVVSVLDINNHVLAKRKFSFTRENQGVKSDRIPKGFAVYMANRDTLEASIHCLAPISNLSEQAYVISDSLNWVNLADLKRFFYYFWLSRDSVNPLLAWQKYLDNVMAANNSFDEPGLKGYRTDRGRVYLQYGKPNQRIVQINNPATYPYEIWQYYRLSDGQTNVKFVFYTTTPETNNYVLLQSTANGEVKNPKWQVILYSRMGTPSDIDQQTIQDQLGEDVNDEYNNPH